MLSTTSSLAPVVLAVLLGWTGAVKLFGARTAQQAPKTALARMLRSSERATLLLRGTGAAELVIAAGLLALPASAVPGGAAAFLGVGFVGYLAYGRAVAPEAGCGCSSNESLPVPCGRFTVPRTIWSAL
ncbi:MauE/DoxX family redox-associated membrane protein, partial [Streptomyces albidus (ex Kaewkla and Franco 2022)]|uniref:MauE/DoxX family redox-associated membrane protein n=1 Tax=Streptomyces albidus (ex Kaewkla and Franco 2022) TaxID=722709 RepID=UPI002E248EBF